MSPEIRGCGIFMQNLGKVLCFRKHFESFGVKHHTKNHAKKNLSIHKSEHKCGRLKNWFSFRIS